MKCSTDEIAGVPCRVLRPPQPHEHEFMVLFLPDDASGVETVTSPQGLSELEACRLTVVIPEFEETWGLDLDRGAGQESLRQVLVQRLVPALGEYFQVDPLRMGLLGQGMGGQAALRLAFDHPQVFPVVVAIAPKIDFHLLVRHGHESLTASYGDEEAARQDTAILHLHPLNWPRHLFFCGNPEDYVWYDGADRLRMKMAASGILFECDLDSNFEGAEQPYEFMQLPVALKFIQGRLDRERLRIV